MPLVWSSALVSHRLEGMDETTLRDWLTSREILEAHHGARSFASYYAILAGSTDRMPSRDLGSLIEQLDGKPVSRMDADGRTLLVPHPLDPQGLMAVHGSAWRADKSTPLPPDTAVKSDLAYFADAYAALRWGDYPGAFDRFVAMAERYPIEGYPLGYAAYAASKTGDKEALEKYVIASMTDASFDYWLARAFFAAGHKDADAALGALQMAFRRRPSTGYRPILTAYQYAEACEWLYKDSGDLRFKNALLEWLRKHQVIQPTQAWAYAMDYTYESAGRNRVRALAMTRYLDPGSERIRGASALTIGAANAWLRDHNPFRAAAPKPQMTGSAAGLIPLSWAIAARDSRPHEQQPQSSLSGGQTDR